MAFQKTIILAVVIVLVGAGAIFFLMGYQIPAPVTQQPTGPGGSEQIGIGMNVQIETTGTQEIPTRTFRMTIFHTGYSPSTLRVNAAEKVRIEAVTGPGTTLHNHGVTIDEYGVNQAVTTEDANNPVIIEFLADKKGTFSIYCGTCKDGIFGVNHPDIRATLIVE